MKWPSKDCYNAHRRASQRALEHAVRSHLEEEIEFVNPVSIAALGGAAWDTDGGGP
jgi:hypothetical protein